MPIQTPICDFGKKAVPFELKSTDEKILKLEDIKGENGTLIMFICNHCPYVKAVTKDIVEDCNNLKKIGINYLYIPDNKSIYPNGTDKNIKIHSFNKKLCGKLRPGHFKAVVDVINRFIHIIKPNKIYLGEKDFQQFLIIKDYVNKKYKNISIVKCKTVREKNGLAYSSRNYLLTKNEKITAGKIYKIISKNKKKIIKKNTKFKKIKKRNL